MYSLYNCTVLSKPGARLPVLIVNCLKGVVGIRALPLYPCLDSPHASGLWPRIFRLLEVKKSKLITDRMSVRETNDRTVKYVEQDQTTPISRQILLYTLCI